MLNLQRHEASLGKLNLIHERHGREKRATAFSFPFTFRCKADKLDELARGLRESIFRKPVAGDQQQLVGETDYSIVICPEMKPCELSLNFTGYEMTITPRGSESDSDDDALFLADVKLDKFTVQPYEGGMCDVTFTACARINLGLDAAPALAFSEVGDVVLSLTPPTRPADPEDDESSD